MCYLVLCFYLELTMLAVNINSGIRKFIAVVSSEL